MSFYITLPSDSSKNTYKDNTQSNFTVLLQEPLNISEYEVGLAEINYFHKIKIKIGELTFYNNKSEKIKIADIEAFEGEQYDSIIKRIEKSLLNHFGENSNKIEQNRTFFNNEVIQNHFTYKTKDIINFEGEIFNYFFDISVDKPKKKDDVINVDILNDQILIQPPSFEEYLIIIEHKFDYIHINNSFYIYTNIIEEQIVGNTKTKLLRNVNLQGKFMDNISIIYDNPHYVSLKLTEIQRININIRDNLGQLIDFSNETTRVIVKLHFRPKRYF